MKLNIKIPTKYFTKDILCIKFKYDLLFETEIYLESVYVICVKLGADWKILPIILMNIILKYWIFSDLEWIVTHIISSIEHLSINLNNLIIINTIFKTNIFSNMNTFYSFLLEFFHLIILLILICLLELL